MNSSSNQYNQLVDYLKHYEDKTPKHQKKATKEKTPLSQSEVANQKMVETEHTVEHPQEIDENITPSSEYDKIYDSKKSEIFNDVNKEKSINLLKKTIKGFNVPNFESVMKQELIREYIALQEYERPYISVSELFGCLRKVYFSRLKYQIDLNKQYKDPYLYLFNKMSISIKDVIQSLCQFDEIDKVVISEKFNVKGKVDGIDDNNLIMIFIINPNTSNVEYSNLHYNEGNVYSYILNNEYDYNIDNISIIYMFDNYKQIKHFNIIPNDEEAIKFLDNGLIIKKLIETNQIPDPSINDCKNCPYEKYCIKKENQEQQKRKSVFLM